MASFLEMAGQYVGPVLDTFLVQVGWFFQIALIGVVGCFIIYYWSFKQRALVLEYTKGNKTMGNFIKVRELKDKHGQMKLRSFNIPWMIKGITINLPGSESIYPMKGGKTMYVFIKKDALYFPVTNFVLGQLKINFDEVTQKEYLEYSLEGSGLEVGRDFDAEQAAFNELVEAAEKYKNKKPAEFVAMIGIAIILLLGVMFLVYYAIKKQGDIAEMLAPALNQASLLIQAGQNAATGPG